MPPGLLWDEKIRLSPYFFHTAERQGIEPWVPFDTQTVQVCALDRYATSPI